MINFPNNFSELLGSARRAMDSIVTMAKTRGELALLELEEEKSRLTAAAIWGGVFIFSCLMAIISVGSTALVFFWDQRLNVAIALLVFSLVVSVLAFLFVKRGFKAPLPFSETMAQFKKDRAWLRGN